MPWRRQKGWWGPEWGGQSALQMRHLTWALGWKEHGAGGSSLRGSKAGRSPSAQQQQREGEMRARGGERPRGVRRGGRATWDGGDRGEAPRGGQEDGRGTLGARGQTPQGCAPTRGQQNQSSRSWNRAPGVSIAHWMKVVALHQLLANQSYFGELPWSPYASQCKTPSFSSQIAMDTGKWEQTARGKEQRQKRHFGDTDWVITLLLYKNSD